MLGDFDELERRIDEIWRHPRGASDRSQLRLPHHAGSERRDSLSPNRGSFRAREYGGIFEGGEQSMELAQQAVDFVLTNADYVNYKVFHNVSEVKVEAPVLNPGKMIYVGHNYREHILEMGRGLPDFPSSSLNSAIRSLVQRMKFLSTRCPSSWTMRQNSPSWSVSAPAT